MFEQNAPITPNRHLSQGITKPRELSFPDPSSVASSLGAPKSLSLRDNSFLLFSSLAQPRPWRN